jgi:hypothetical protein
VNRHLKRAQLCWRVAFVLGANDGTYGGEQRNIYS